MRISASLLGALMCCLTLVPASAQQDYSKVQIKTVPVAEGIHMLMGAGGNIGVSSGEDGVFLIDDQFAPLTEKILAAVAKINDGPVRFVLNTHWHGDHSGGNENLGKAGVVIVAHDNVHKMMSVEQFQEFFDRTVPASPKDALPVITYSDNISFHLNGQEIHAFHAPSAHTNGDSIIHFRDSNVFHMGDTYFAGMYPFIDPASGGTVEGVIAAADTVLELADGDSKIIPGHGPLSNKAELKVYRDMLATVQERVAAAIAAGQTEDEVVAAGMLDDLDEEWGKGYFTSERWLRLIHAIETR